MEVFAAAATAEAGEVSVRDVVSKINNYPINQ
jgi:hypothetical protein